MESRTILRLRRPESSAAAIHRSDYDVYHCEYSFDKGITKSGEIRTDIIAGHIKVQIAMLPSDELLHWAFDCQKRFSGEISFIAAHEEVVDKISFEDGRCVAFRMQYDPSLRADKHIMLHFSVYAKQMIIGNVEYKQR
jgi:hypothetical protein